MTQQWGISVYLETTYVRTCGLTWDGPLMEGGASQKDGGWKVSFFFGMVEEPCRFFREEIDK